MSPIDEVQRGLSKAQAFPIAGPLLVSPAKMIVSTAQIIYGIAKAVFFGTIALSTAVLGYSNLAEKSTKEMVSGFAHMLFGTCSLIYSNANFWTLGIVGFTCENYWSDLTAQCSY